MGKILEVTDEAVVFEYEEAKETKKVTLKYEEIARAVRHIEF